MLLGGVSMAGNDKKTILIDDFVHYNFLNSLRFSDCGCRLAYIVSKVDLKENKYKNALFTFDFETKKAQIYSSYDVESFYGFHNGHLLFSTKREKEEKEEKNAKKTYVYGLPVHGGEAVKLYEFPYPLQKLEFLNNDKAVALLYWEKDKTQAHGKEEAEEAEKEEKDYETFEEIPFWANGGGFISRKRSRLYLYDVKNMIGESLTDEFTSVGDFQLDKERGEILFTKSTYKDKAPIYSQLMLYTVKDKKATEINKDLPFMYGDIQFFGKYILFTGSDGKKYGINQDADIYVIERSNLSSSPKMISPADYDKSLWNSVGTDVRLGGGRQSFVSGDKYYFITTEDDSSYLNTIDITGKMEKIVTKKGSVDCFDVKDGKVAFVGLRGQDLQEIYIKEPLKEEERLTNHNSYGDTLNKSVPEEFWFKNDGIDLHGFVVKPTNFEKGKKYPALLSIHGGPKTVFGSVFHHEMQFLANQGFFVFYTNPRGADGMGRAFADIRGKYGTIDYSDLMVLTDEVLKRYQEIDVSRVGVLGGSYGGFMTNWIIGHTDRFKAACSQRSIANWISKFGITDIGYYFNSDQNAGATPWKNVEFMWDRSPLKYADKCKTPTLFIQGDEDYRCFEACAFQMFTALKYHGCEAKLVLFHGENHDLSRSGKPKHRIRRLREICDWFTSYLKG